MIFTAFFDSIAFLAFGLSLAETIGDRIADATLVDPSIILMVQIGACGRDIITWRPGQPTRSSHALRDDMIGPAMVRVGTGALVRFGITKTMLSLRCSVFSWAPGGAAFAAILAIVRLVGAPLFAGHS